MSRSITSKEYAKALAKRQKQAAPRVDLVDHTFPHQAAFILDPSPLKAAFCNRRAGKSMGAARYLLKEALETPGCSCLYVALSRDSAKKIIWKDCLKVLNRQYKLNAKFNETTLTVTMANGSIIYVLGVDASEDEKQKLLGQKYRLAVIDEAASYSIDLKELVYGIIKPAVSDYRGTICLIGTPGNLTRGLYFDVTNGKEPGWSVHKWTAYDNPYQAAKAKAEVEELIAANPLIQETSLFKQHYLGEWVVDDTKLVYKFNAVKNLFKTMPEKLKADGFSFVLGVDPGWEDDNAFVLTCYHENDPNLYILKTYNKNHMTFDEVADKIKEFMADPYCAPSRVIIDVSAKQGIETMRAKTNIPFEFAEKQAKSDFIEIMNADFVQAKIKIHETCRPLIEELSQLIWKMDGERVAHPRKEHPSLPNHLCDAMLYAWRLGYHHHWSNVKDIVPKYSRKWYEQQGENIWEKERQKIVQEYNQDTLWPDHLNQGFNPFDPESGNF